MALAEIRQRFDHERRTLARDDEIIEVLPQLSRMRLHDGSWHAVTISTLSGDDADAAIIEQIEHYRTLRVEFEWTVCAHDQPADLTARLARHGFEIGPCETILVLDLHDPPPWIDRPTSHRVLRVEGPQQLELYRQATEQVFPEGGTFIFNRLSRHLHSDSKQQVGYVALADGQPASAGRLETHPNSVFAGLYGGGTVAAFRGRGLYRAIVAARARDAQTLGARYLIVDALPTSRPILERLGFVRLTDSWPCTFKPA